MEKYRAIGIMSGTSLDGVDIAACEFFLAEGKWSYSLHFTHCAPYPDEWKAKLAGLASSDALTFSVTNTEYGHLLGRIARSFIDSTGFMPDFIASHGHTVFHQPEIGLTVQIGLGSAIAAETGVPVICDFRSGDVALGGQGAPLVPVGDSLLFYEYDACLNIGGFANISMVSNSQRIAFDICPANIALNHFAARSGMDYDKNGSMARSGRFVQDLFNKLNDLPFYHKPWPKSLGREWLEREFLPEIEKYNAPIQNILATVVEHIAFQVHKAFPEDSKCKVLITGGGAHNVFLMERIMKISHQNHFRIPVKKLVDYKEAIIFAFLGVLRIRHENNALYTVTGSRKNNSGGAIYSL